jgi:uncharacterized membrane protein YtjA (UPF0391 family)
MRVIDRYQGFICAGASSSRTRDAAGSYIFSTAEKKFFAHIETATEIVMLHYAIVFLVIALIAAVLGFGGIAGAAAGIAKILFTVFIILFIAALVMGRRSPKV